MKKILFRADAKPSIGIGDLMSLIHLSKYLDNWEKHFVIRNYRAGVDLAKKYRVENLYILDENISIEDEVDFLNKFDQMFNENKTDLRSKLIEAKKETRKFTLFKNFLNFNSIIEK